ncbi:MAG: hypothetical protein Q8P90_02870 [bacterium]|nr:hypothetical protein [bacterium]
MGNFNRGGDSRGGDTRGGGRGNSGSRGSSGGSGSYGGRRDSRDDKPMYPAVCAECNQNCQVPFKPTGNKPVLCRDCFSNEQPGGGRGGNDRSRGGDRRNDRRGSDRSRGSMSDGRSEHYELEFEKLNNKLDKILRRLTPVHTRDGIKESDEEESEEPEDQDNQ